MIDLIDSHCHLDFDRFRKDRDAVVKAAEKAGLLAIINPGVDLKSSRAAVALADNYPMVFAAVGIHPHGAKTFDRETKRQLRELAQHPKVVAIGEIGLDFYRNYSPPAAQQSAFEAQLELAGELDLPVIVHDRQASQETMSILERWTSSGAPRGGVLHSYSAGVEWIDSVTEIDFFIGISGPVTFPQATDLHQVAEAAPLDRLFIETDAPFLTPNPYHGRRNEPAYVRYIAEKIATLRGLPPRQVGKQTTKNVAKLFDPIGNVLEQA